MSGRSDERSVETLRRRAERAMDEGRGRGVVEPLLERILKVAPEGDPGRIFAHRHLAELQLEEDPWAAALHLRKVIGARPHDDVAHSLMALAQALLGNYHAAVGSYRRALALEPRNPWYHHNLGHLLDVALDRPKAALHHLEIALAHADPPEHEITASMAHCLARVGRHEQARELAQAAVRAAPDNREHRALLQWIDTGSTAGGSADGSRGFTMASVRELRASAPDEALEGSADHAAVVRVLEQQMEAAGFSARQVASARSLWVDYRRAKDPRVKRPEIYAAAVHFAIVVLQGLDGITKASIARHYGVAPQSVGSRFGDIERVLALQPHDPRYVER
jgi:tetratricopeptide (TPR) repeat protein